MKEIRIRAEMAELGECVRCTKDESNDANKAVWLEPGMLQISLQFENYLGRALVSRPEYTILSID